MIVLILFIIICVLLTSMTVYNYLYTKKIETEDVPESSSLSMLVDTCALDKEILEDCKRQKVDRLYDEISKLAKGKDRKDKKRFSIGSWVEIVGG